VDAVVTDPPYGISYRSPSGARILNDSAAYIWWLHEAWRVTAKNGALVCFCRWDVQEDFRWAIELAGWKVKSQVIWDRMLHGMGDIRATFAPRHDVIWFAVKGKYRFPSGRPTSVIQTQRVKSGLVHPTEKPVELMERLVEAVVRPAGIVLDPCMGSGSTGVACVRKGYRFIGMELDADHFNTARRRIVLRSPSRKVS
jgi:site-specific DNA-methyltransferase (adenine-specific)